jgi:antitoxin (DNA-binding transcriptional repressor) of toxin-antitoxin stability system
MKTLTIREAAGNLAKWLRLAVAGEEIAIRADDSIVALRPLPNEGTTEKLAPREALRRLQQNARLKPEDADHYLEEVRAERLAADKRAA